MTMWICLSESLISGIVVWVQFTILFNLIMNKSNKNKEKPCGIDMAFFITGIILYLITQLIK